MKSIRSKIRIAFYFFSYYLGLIHLSYYFNMKKKMILTYHHVIPDDMWDDKLHLVVAITESHFRKQLKIIKDHFNQSSKTVDSKIRLLITFDDGYKCALRISEILDEFGFVGIFFVPVSNINSTSPLWIDEIMRWFSYVPYNKYCIKGIEYNILSERDRLEGYKAMLSKLEESYTPQTYLEALNRIYPFKDICQKIPNEYNNLRFNGLTTLEIQKMQERGHVIGGHSVYHDILSKLSLQNLEEDFHVCESLIGSVYNSKLYAYPFGHINDINDKVIKCCNQSDFSHAFINDNIENNSEYKIPRVNIGWYKNQYEIHAHLSGYANTLKKWIKLIS